MFKKGTFMGTLLRAVALVAMILGIIAFFLALWVFICHIANPNVSPDMVSPILEENFHLKMKPVSSSHSNYGIIICLVILVTIFFFDIKSENRNV